MFILNCGKMTPDCMNDQTRCQALLMSNFCLINTQCLALVVRRLDNAIHWIKLYLVDNTICFAITYLLDRNLSIG